MEGLIRILRFDLAHLEQVLAIQRASPETAQWSSADYERVLGKGVEGWVAEQDGEVAGFVVARQVTDELEILNLAVAPESRRQRVGSRLLEVTLAWGRQAGARPAFLEVRASNQTAISFYAHHGFAATGRRPNYYADPREDALVLSRDLD